MASAGGGIASLAGAWWFLGRPEVAQTTEVTLKNSQFHPRNIEVSTGDEVTWTNEDSIGGDVDTVYILKSATSGWDFEAELAEGDSTSHTFEESGIYELYDEVRGQEDLSGASMNIGVDEKIADPLGGWF
jgi:plastocyanin